MVASLVSALHYLASSSTSEKAKNENVQNDPLSSASEMASNIVNYGASLFFETAKNFLMDTDQPQKINSLDTKMFPWLQARKIKMNLDLLDATKWTIYPRNVVLMSSNGNCEHAVTIVGGLIFDSTLSHTIPLCKENLYWSCIDSFKCVRGGYEYCEMPDKKYNVFQVDLPMTVFQDVKMSVETQMLDGMTTTRASVSITPRKRKFSNVQIDI